MVHEIHNSLYLPRSKRSNSQMGNNGLSKPQVEQSIKAYNINHHVNQVKQSTSTKHINSNPYKRFHIHASENYLTLTKIKV